jgi:hypothetical protein
MECKYNVGIDANTINTQVNTGTAATCYTSVYQAGQTALKTESTKTSNGSIVKTPIGTAAGLKNIQLIIKTVVDFSALPNEIIEAIKADHSLIKKYVTIKYIFDGGFDGIQNFGFDMDDCAVSSTGRMAEVVKQIDFVTQ